jgi:hypothetical protein
MKFSIYPFIILLFILTACSSNKDVAHRKNYMMPKKSDLARNSKYTPQKAKTTYTVKNNQTKKTKKVYGN